MRRATWLIVTGLTLALPIVAGCGGASSATGSSGGGDGGGQVAVVTSTNVWGDIVRQLGGAQVAVTSLISDPSADPHSYEADAQNQLAVSRAAIVVQNGGGYDDFVDSMIRSSGSRATLLDAVTISGITEQHGSLNEHVWYDLPAVRRIAQRIAAALTEKDPAHTADYAANAAAFDRAVGALVAQEATVRISIRGAGVAITEPVPLYLLEAVGAVNRTPPAFSKAIEDETDVPPATLAATLALFTGHQVKALVYNEQTTGRQTDVVVEAAKAAGVPVVPVTETLPAGQTYQSWMKANLDAVGTALR